MTLRRLRLLLLCLLLLLAGGVSLKTVAPTIYIEDSGQFVSSVVRLGHNHPPGYVLYNLLAHPFTWLPLGETAFRVNLFSTLAALGSLAFLFRFALLLCNDTLVAVLACLLLTFSLEFWALSSQSEVYQLNLFFFSGTLYWLYQAKLSGRRGYAFLLYFWLGLSFNNHYLQFFFAPLICLTEWSWTHRYTLKGIWQRAAALCLGYSPVLALPLRSLQKVSLDWGGPDNWRTLLDLLRRSQFKHLEFSQPIGRADKLRFLGNFSQELQGQFQPLLLLLAFFGLYWLFKKERRLTILAVSLGLLGSAGLILLLHFPYNYENTTRFSVYYLPVYWLTALFLGAGLKYFKDKDSFPLPWTILWLAVPLGLGFLHYPQVSLRHNYTGFDQGINLLTNLPAQATLYAQGNNIVFPLSYLTYVQGRRPDLMIYDLDAGVFPTADLTTIPPSELNFFTLLKAKPAGRPTQPYGLFFQEDGLANFASERFFRWRTKELLAYGEKEVLAAYFYFLGLNRLATAGNQAERYFQQATIYGGEILWLRNNLSQNYLARGLISQAKSEAQAALQLAPFDPVVHFNLGLVLAKGERNYPAALKHFDQALALDPEYAAALQAKKLASKLGGSR